MGVSEANLNLFANHPGQVGFSELSVSRPNHARTAFGAPAARERCTIHVLRMFASLKPNLPNVPLSVVHNLHNGLSLVPCIGTVLELGVQSVYLVCQSH